MTTGGHYIGFKLDGLPGWFFFRAEAVDESEGRLRCRGAGWYCYDSTGSVVTVTELNASEHVIEARTETDGLP